MNYTQPQLDACLRNNFPAFCQKVFHELNPGTKFVPNWHLEAICHVLDQIESRRVILAAPPRSFKSTIVSVAFVAFMHIRQPELKFVCVSYSQELADKHAADHLRVVNSAWYKRLSCAPPPLRVTGSEYVTHAGGFRKATSIDGSLTGFGADCIVVDDPINGADAHSKAMRDRANAWFNNTALSRLNNQTTGRIIVVAQRHHVDDLPGYLLAKGGWDYFCFPAIAPADMYIPISDTRKHFWKAGTPLDEHRLPLSTLENLKRSMGADTFSAQYLQDPAPPSGNLLKTEWLKYGDSPTPQPDDEIVISWDTAMKGGQQHDYSVGLVFLIRKNVFYLIDCYRGRPDFPTLLKEIYRLAKKHNPSTVLIEDAVSGTPLIQTVKDLGLQGVIGRRPEGDKIARANAQSTFLEAGDFVLPKVAPWLSEFELEYRAFPKGRHDDQIDALVQFLTWYRNRPSRAYFESDFDNDPDPDGAPSAGMFLRLLRKR